MLGSINLTLEDAQTLAITLIGSSNERNESRQSFM